MMDFEDAAVRLARDQSKLRGRKPVAVLSEKAKRQAEYQRKQRARQQAERERKRRLAEYQIHYMRSCDRALHVKSLSPSTNSSTSTSASSSTSTNMNNNGLQLKATSIYGQGDKITLPPSLLEMLAKDIVANNNSNSGNPWAFRIGIVNPKYQFPASPLIHTLKVPTRDDTEFMVDDDDSDDDDDDSDKAAYMDELRHKYLAYTHCTVVEFTQEEGHVGIPQPIALALFNNEIPTYRTVDPASAASSPDDDDDDDGKNDNNDQMDVSEQTPGHVAWNAFDIPDLPLEITMVQLPRGRGCTLVPTQEAVHHGFYGLKDVKMVLEQSLIRTRATLSVGDVVSTWHRGVQFDLTVTEVVPSGFGALTCINTDIEVDIGETEMASPPSLATGVGTGTGNPQTGQPSSGSHMLGKGQTLGSASTTTTVDDTQKPVHTSASTPPPPPSTLLPEPPTDQTENICNVQIRFSGGNGKRRLDVQNANVKDLMDFAASIMGKDVATSSFRLVTRFPRRVFSINSSSSISSTAAADYNASSTTLLEAGIQPGQELFMAEMI